MSLEQGGLLPPPSLARSGVGLGCRAGGLVGQRGARGSRSRHAARGLRSLGCGGGGGRGLRCCGRAVGLGWLWCGGVEVDVARVVAVVAQGDDVGGVVVRVEGGRGVEGQGLVAAAWGGGGTAGVARGRGGERRGHAEHELLTWRLQGRRQPAGLGAWREVDRRAGQSGSLWSWDGVWDGGVVSRTLVLS